MERFAEKKEEKEVKEQPTLGKKKGKAGKDGEDDPLAIDIAVPAVGPTFTTPVPVKTPVKKKGHIKVKEDLVLEVQRKPARILSAKEAEVLLKQGLLRPKNVHDALPETFCPYAESGMQDRDLDYQEDLSDDDVNAEVLNADEEDDDFEEVR